MLDLSTIVAFVIGMLVGPVLVVVILYLLLIRFSRKRDAPKLDPPDLPGKIVSLDFNVRTLKGEEVNLEQLRAGRPMFLNFWATWCGPCVMEMSSIEALYKSCGHHIAFACVSSEEAEDLHDFLKKTPYSFPIYRIDETPDDFAAPGIPATFVLSSSREIMLQHVGAADWSDPSVIDFVGRLRSPPALDTGNDCIDGICTTDS